MEATIEELIEAIDKDDYETLEALLKDCNCINDYFIIEQGVLMTPLLYAIKMKSPDCVDILVHRGADIDLSLKMCDPDDPEEESKQKSLHTKALKYALGEKKKATLSEDRQLYDDIVQILQEAKSKNVAAASLESLSSNEKSASVVAPIAINLAEQNHGDGAALMSPQVVADAHRFTQKIIQNQNAIKKLTEENEALKAEINSLKQELQRIKPWIERWIYEGHAPGLPPPGLHSSEPNLGKPVRYKSESTATTEAAQTDRSVKTKSSKSRHPKPADTEKAPTSARSEKRDLGHTKRTSPDKRATVSTTKVSEDTIPAAVSPSSRKKETSKKSTNEKKPSISLASNTEGSTNVTSNVPTTPKRKESETPRKKKSKAD